MRADMRSKITFLEPPSGVDEYGAPNTTWTEKTTGKNIWASKEPLLGNEFFSAQAVNTDVQVKFRCHYLSGIENKMRIKHGSEIYEILSAINVKSLNRELLCYCKKVV